MARRGGLVRLLVTLILLLLAPLLAAAAAEAAAPAQNASEEAEAEHPPPYILPRPLIIELPSSAAEEALGEVPADAVAASLEVEVEVDLVPAAPAQDASEEVAAEAQQQHLPRPLVIDLPSSSAAGPRGGDDVPADVRCASWRLAAEANNLAPWKAVPAECAAHVRDYVTGVAYRSDLELVARESAAYARAAPLRGDGRDAWVFDVDETLLSNLPYYADHGYG